MDKDHTLHGLECYRDVYFKIGEESVLKRFGVKKDISELFNGVYTPHIKEEGFELKSTAQMKAEGYFYVLPKSIQGDITIKRDLNLIDEFEITILANFMESRNLRLLEHSTGNEKLNYEVPGSKVVQSTGIPNSSLPYYPLMDTVLLGNLYVSAQLGYVNSPQNSIRVEGRCVGLVPRFRKDGLPIVTFTFRDVGWAMGMHVFSQSYPILAKDGRLENITNVGEFKTDG